MFLKDIKNKAKKNFGNVGVGIGENSEFILKSIKKAKSEKYAKITIFDEPINLIKSLKNNEIDSAIRGNLSAKPVLSEIKKTFKKDILIRLAILQTIEEKTFFLAPVGIDEGINIKEKMAIINYSVSFLKKLGVFPNIGLLSGGRFEDIGRGKEIDNLVNEGIDLEEYFKFYDYNVKHYGILIEEAVKESNLIIAPNGIFGNYIFRTLYFLGGGESIGAPLINIDKIYVDTSSSKKDYSLSIALASALI